MSTDTPLQKSPVKLRWPLLALIVFIIYSYATYHKPHYTEGNCPLYAASCECVDNDCNKLVFTVR